MSSEKIKAEKALVTIAVILGIVLTGVLLYKLAPVLSPFLIAAALAYLTDPLVEKWSQGKYKIPRTLAVILVFLLVIILVVLAMLFLIPLLQQQITILVAKIPSFVEWFQKDLLPKLVAMGLAPNEVGIEELKAQALKHASKATDLAKWMWETLFYSGQMIVGWAVNAFIIFIVGFYLLRDWPRILKGIQSILPKAYAPTILRLTKRCDGVLSAFARGQLSLMAALAVIYSVGLGLLGINFWLLLGVFAGILSIVPYLGSLVGLLAALVIAYMQYHAWFPILGVLGIFAVGHILEMVVLAPIFVGDKLGLHPVAVIFAILAGGHLLGLVGVILALPLTAMIVVLVRDELLNPYSEKSLSTQTGERSV